MFDVMGVFEKLISVLARLLNARRNEVSGLTTEVMDSLRTVHDDYLRTFREVEKKLANREVPTIEVIEFLKDQRMLCLTLRDESKNLAEKIAIQKSIFLTKAEIDLLQDFANQIVDYFRQYGDVSAATWYSGFISALEARARFPMTDNNDVYEVIDQSFGNRPTAELQQKASRICVVILQRYSSIHRSYLKLQEHFGNMKS